MNNMKITKTNVYGFEASLRGMRNAKNSWHLSDSFVVTGMAFLDENSFMMYDKHKEDVDKSAENYVIGDKDMFLCQTLIRAGAEHMKFMRQIQVWADIAMPRYWWSEFDTYKIGTAANSTSTMHKLFDKQSEITLDLFVYDEYTKDIILGIIDELNLLRDCYFKAELQSDKDTILKRAKIILPESYINTRTVNMNYATIRNIVLQRKLHRLKEEWQDTFCAWATTLPYAKELIFCGLEKDYERLK